MTFTDEDKIEQRLATIVAARGYQPEVYLSELISREFNRDKVQLDNYTEASDNRLSDYLNSKWPGDETDEEMMALAAWVED